jgi:hypothetical protein
VNTRPPTDLARWLCKNFNENKNFAEINKHQQKNPGGFPRGGVKASLENKISGLDIVLQSFNLGI